MIWAIWFGAAMLAFAAIELTCIMTGRKTLSGTIRTVTLRYPLVLFLFGCIVGGLIIHFWGSALTCKGM